MRFGYVNTNGIAIAATGFSEGYPIHPPLSGFAHPITLPPRVERNIRALLAHRHDEERQSTQNRLADAIKHVTGGMTFVYADGVFFGLWIAINLGWATGAAIRRDVRRSGDGRVGRSNFPVEFRSDQSE